MSRPESRPPRPSGPQIPRFLLLDAAAGLLVTDLPIAMATGAVLLSWLGGPGASWWSALVLPAVLATAMLSALRTGADRIRDRFEMRFWSDVEIAAIFFAMAVIAQVPTHIAPWTGSLWSYVPSGCLLFLAYSRLLLATELQPHRDAFWRSEQLERRLSLLTSTTFGAGIFGYFAVIPALLSGQVVDAGVAVAYLFAVMSALLALRLGLFAWRVQDLRWRSMYRVMASAAVLSTTFHGLQAASWGASETGSASRVLWTGAVALWIFAVRLRHHPFPADWRPTAPDAEAADDPVAQNQLGLDFRTLLLAIAAPLLHVVGYRWGFLLPAAEDVRELWLLFWTAGLGGLAVAQQRISSERLDSVLYEQRRITRTLAAGERRLQMVEERKAADEALYYSREKYAKAFRSSPFGLFVLRAEDGEHLDVNDRYVEMLGRSRTDLLQSSFADLTVAGDAVWSELNERLAEESRLVNEDVEVLSAAGETRRLRLSAASLETQDGPCRLVICTDLSIEEDRREDIRNQADLLRRASDPALVFDRRGRVLWMNEAAVDGFGPLPDAEPGQIQRFVEPGPELTAADLATREGRHWMGRLSFRLGSEARELDTWWLPVRRKGKERQDRLVLLLTPREEPTSETRDEES